MKEPQFHVMTYEIKGLNIGTEQFVWNDKLLIKDAGTENRNIAEVRIFIDRPMPDFDDKSNDNSRSVLKKFIKNKKIKIFFNKNKKTNLAALDAANGYYFLFKKSKGKIICLLDSVDFFHKDKIIQVSNFFMNNKSYDFVQNLPVILENKKKIYKKNNNNFLSYWPYFAPESCINFKRNFTLRFIKKNKYLNHKFADVWLGFRMGAYAFFIENTCRQKIRCIFTI